MNVNVLKYVLIIDDNMIRLEWVIGYSDPFSRKRLSKGNHDQFPFMYHSPVEVRKLLIHENVNIGVCELHFESYFVKTNKKIYLVASPTLLWPVVAMFAL